jgi:hypothetical protein
MIGFILAMLGAAALGAGVGAVVGAVVVLTIDMIDDWIQRNKVKHPDAETIEIIKTKLAEGKYVKVRIFNRRNEALESQAWKYEQLDPDLENKFQNRQKIRIAI